MALTGGDLFLLSYMNVVNVEKAPKTYRRVMVLSLFRVVPVENS